MNKKIAFVFVSVILILVLVATASFFLFRKNIPGLNNLTGNISNQSRFPTKNYPEVTASLQIVQRAAPNANQIQVVYRDTRPFQKILGFSIDVVVSPAISSAVAADITPGPNFTTDNFLFPLRKASAAKAGTVYSLAAIRTNPKADVSLKDGDVLATYTLKGAKGTYQVSIDNKATTVLNESNVSLTKSFEGNVSVKL